MRRVKLVIAALFLISPFAANADLIEYTGNNFFLDEAGNAYFLTAVADVTYTGAGDYVEGSGLNWFQLNLYSLFQGVYYLSLSIGNLDSDYSNQVFYGNLDGDYSNQGLVNYLTIDDSLNVTNWQLFAQIGDDIVAWTIGNDVGGPTNCFCGTQDSAVFPPDYNTDYLFNFYNQNNAGTWTSVAVPEPGTHALLLAGLIGMGMARRRKKA